MKLVELLQSIWEDPEQKVLIFTFLGRKFSCGSLEGGCTTWNMNNGQHPLRNPIQLISITRGREAVEHRSTELEMVDV